MYISTSNPITFKLPHYSHVPNGYEIFVITHDMSGNLLYAGRQQAASVGRYIVITHQGLLSTFLITGVEKQIEDDQTNIFITGEAIDEPYPVLDFIKDSLRLNVIPDAWHEHRDIFMSVDYQHFSKFVDFKVDGAFTTSETQCHQLHQFTRYMLAIHGSIGKANRDRVKYDYLYKDSHNV